MYSFLYSSLYKSTVYSRLYSTRSDIPFPYESVETYYLTIDGLQKSATAFHAFLLCGLNSTTSYGLIVRSGEDHIWYFSIFIFNHSFTRHIIFYT